MALISDYALPCQRINFNFIYQPIVELVLMVDVIKRALIRWNHPDKGLIGAVRVCFNCRRDKIDFGYRRLGVPLSASRQAARWRASLGPNPNFSI